MTEKRRRSTGKSTLADVARLVGVSAMTASRALRMPEKVSPEIRAGSTRPSRNWPMCPTCRRVTASASSRLITMVVPSFATPGSAIVSEALQEVLRPQGYNMMLAEANHSAAEESERSRCCSPTTRPRWCTSISIMPPKRSAAEQLRPAGDGHRRRASGFCRHQHRRGLCESHSPAGKQRWSAAIATRPAVHTNAQHYFPSAAQWLAQRDAGAESGTAPRSDLTENAHLCRRPQPAGRDPSHRPELDVLICTSDEVACGAIMACHAAGVSVPSQLAIASIGGGPLAAVCSPPRPALCCRTRRWGAWPVNACWRRSTATSRLPSMSCRCSKLRASTHKV